MAVDDGHHHRTLSRRRVDNGSASTSLGVNRVVRGGCGRALEPPRWREGCQGTAMVANRTGESPPSGMTRGALGNMAMVELCTHPAIERAGLETLHLRCVRPSSIPTAVNCLVRTASISDACEGNDAGSARMEKSRLPCGLCRSGRGDLGGEQTRRLERKEW